MFREPREAGDVKEDKEEKLDVPALPVKKTFFPSPTTYCRTFCCSTLSITFCLMLTPGIELDRLLPVEVDDAVFVALFVLLLHVSYKSRLISVGVDGEYDEINPIEVSGCKECQLTRASLPMVIVSSLQVDSSVLTAIPHS